MSNRPSRPEGMAWINPALMLKDVKGSMAFYEKAFGFKTRLTLPDKEGNIVHAEMTYKDQPIMMGPEQPDRGRQSAATLNGSPVVFYLYVDDIDGFFEKVKSLGAEVVAGLTDQFWGDRTFTVKCPEGYQWTFSQNVADYDPDNNPY